MHGPDLPTRARVSADVAIIGAGSAGLVVASGAAQLGLKVVLFEKGEMGGDCLNYGCVPSKALIAAGRAAQSARNAHRFGVRAGALSIDWREVAAHVRGVIEAIAPVDSQERFESLGVRVIREAARFIDPHTLVSETAEVRARKFVIATGARAFIPPIPGLSDVGYLTNESIFSLEEMPQRLLILGGGAIGVELGQAFRRLGAEIIIVEAKEILASADLDARAVLRERLDLEGVMLRENVTVTRVERADDGGARVMIEGAGGQETIAATHLLVATGRRPMVDGLDLDKANVAYDARGVRTDIRLRTTNRRVWAIGDVAGREQFTHAAGFHAGLFVRNALFRVSRAGADSTPIPRVVYAEPEIAEVGLSEADARAQHGERVRTLRWSLEDNDRATAERAQEGFAKIVVAPGGRVVGAAIVGDGAGDLIAILQFAIANGLKIGALAQRFLPAYPTRSEVVKRAAGRYFAASLFSPKTRAAVAVLSRLP